jgi:phosphoketolase
MMAAASGAEPTTSPAADQLQALARYRAEHPEADRWAQGYGVIHHAPETQLRVFAMVEALRERGERGDGLDPYVVLHAADVVTNAVMWLVVHETYARNVYLDGRELTEGDFKPHPEGHTGGSLNMVPAYVGYFAVNALTGFTRSWLMGQGHCVAAIDSTNVLLENMGPAHGARYGLTDDGLTRYVRDFYSYRLNEQGLQDSPLGSHVNVHTAGGMVEGGYLGFSELQYVHMPLPGERLVAFLSDGAFEEQRGSDWTPRWWRAEDCGLVVPIMINNGRRIDQRTTLSQAGGPGWFARHLELHSFAPFIFDGRDPAAFAWAIFDAEERLLAAAEEISSGRERYPARIPYGIAVAPKGAGFVNEGTNLAHNLPLMANPRSNASGARAFNEGARRLWVPLPGLREAVTSLRRPEGSGRVAERDHPVAHRHPELPSPPLLDLGPVSENRRDPRAWRRSSPMVALDRTFLAFVQANPALRPRVGNPDEMRSNRLQATLDALQFRVTDPEPSIPESSLGAVVTALNEEAVVSAALGNKGGINLVATYEAFGAKMHGVLRQEIIFAQHQVAAGRPPGWLSVPVVLTSHTWENAKNEQSHQDPALAEALLGEASHVSRVVFVPDAATAAVTLRGVYASRGQVWSLIVPKSERVPEIFSETDAQLLLEQGALRLRWTGLGERPRLLLTAIGAYQLEQVLVASTRLNERGVSHAVNYMIEPGRFREPRSEDERAHAASGSTTEELFPQDATARLFVTHTRPEPMLGVLRPLDTGSRSTKALGWLNRGGTLSIEGLMFVNGCSWAHIVAESARLLDLPASGLLTPDEVAALEGRASPHGIVIEEAP